MSTATRVSVIVPTIGRPDALRRLLESLRDQTIPIHEIIIADGSQDPETDRLTRDQAWSGRLAIQRLDVHPPNAVRQRQAAIAAATGDLILFLDDDVVLEADCVERMVEVLQAQPSVVGVVANFSNQTWPMPTRAWRFYLRRVAGLGDGDWQGRVVGPLLRFGYEPVPVDVVPMEWLSTCNTMIRRAAYESVGGFSDFFLHRCTMNEDVDLGLKLSRVGRIVLNPAARLSHFHAPSGRVTAQVAAEDDLYNRYLILRVTLGRSAAAAFGLVLVFFAIETTSNLIGMVTRLRSDGLGARTLGRIRALARILGLIGPSHFTAST
jgi:GT2 family glycosyltransferase